MLNLSSIGARHLDLSSTNLALRRIFPWAHSIRKIMHIERPQPFSGRHLFVGSDYGGTQNGSSYQTYAYLISCDTPSTWLHNQKQVRRVFLPDGRRMSFKGLNDGHRQNALVPVLQAADQLDGHLVVIAKEKSIKLSQVNKRDVEHWADAFNISKKWKPRPFESALLKTHIFGLIIAQWSTRLNDVTWITDEDDFVANEQKLDDAQIMAARFNSMYSSHPMGVFAMNSTAIDGPGNEFEDFVAIADLAAGTISDLMNSLSKSPTARRPVSLKESELRHKTDLIIDWFWFPDSRLKKTCIVIDKQEDSWMVYKLDQLGYESRYTSPFA